MGAVGWRHSLRYRRLDDVIYVAVSIVDGDWQVSTLR
jgi:hypothetical protein